MKNTWFLHTTTLSCYLQAVKTSWTACPTCTPLITNAWMWQTWQVIQLKVWMTKLSIIDCVQTASSVSSTSFEKAPFENNARKELTYPACWHASHSFCLWGSGEADCSGVLSKVLSPLRISAPLRLDVRFNLFRSFFLLSSPSHFGHLDSGSFSVIYLCVCVICFENERRLRLCPCTFSVENL